MWERFWDTFLSNRKGISIYYWFIENKIYEKYGISNVRGGSFCEINLSRDNYSTLQRMIKGTDNKCYTCGKKDITQAIVLKHMKKKKYGNVLIVVKSLIQKEGWNTRKKVL